MGRHSIPSSGGPEDPPGEPEAPGGPPSGRIPRADTPWQGRRRAVQGGRRGVSAGVIVALVTVVLLVGGVILWQFFGDALSRRSTDAAQQCVQGTADIPVVADGSIVDSIVTLAEAYNDEASPVGDMCVNVVVSKADSDSVFAGLTGEWPAGLGQRPALWIPASSIQAARLQAAIGAAVVSDARSLVTSPVLLAVRPELKAALGQRDWADLPRLQSNPAALDEMDLPGWGGLRLALPSAGAADAGYLAAEAVAATSAPPGAPATAGIGAAMALLGDQPLLEEATADAAWQAMVDAPDPAAAPVHAVTLTEQQLYQRVRDLPDASTVIAGWTPSGPVAVADYPTVLLSGDWLSEEQVAAASEFARFMGKPEQLRTLAESGFRAEGADNPAAGEDDVVAFGPLAERLQTGDDQVRATVAGAFAPGAVAATTVMLDQSVAGAAAAALRDRVATLPPGAAVGLWVFDGTEGATAIPFGALSDPLGDQTRQNALSDALGAVGPGSSGAVSFTTLRLVFTEALANFLPGEPNSVLVITQGPHTDRTLDGDGLQEFVASALDPNRPVAINVIDIGDDPDRPVWEAVTQLTGGSYADVPGADSPEFVAALAQALT
ncbi:MAG: hypothetical protein KDB50_10665 [Mycobacterium sp.]|nr:hypothetical protein [Mycobacterium sp.]